MLSTGQVLDGRVRNPRAPGGRRDGRGLPGAAGPARRRGGGQGDPGACGRPAPLERFVLESRACAQLRHPNTVSIFDYNADNPQRPFLVMELLNGPSLKKELARRGPFSVDELTRIIPPICSALALAHARGIVHRDLKPANLVAHDFSPGERVYKVVDSAWPTSGNRTGTHGSPNRTSSSAPSDMRRPNS